MLNETNNTFTVCPILQQQQQQQQQQQYIKKQEETRKGFTFKNKR